MIKDSNEAMKYMAGVFVQGNEGLKGTGELTLVLKVEE